MNLVPFREWLLLQEAKSVGVIYHFTRLTSLKDIEDSNFCLGSHQHYVSFTRNFDLSNKDFYKNDMSVLKGDDKRIVRMAIDGTALSNHYKIEPFLDLEYGVKRKQGEWEERILKHGIKKSPKETVCIKPYIKQIDVLHDDGDFIKDVLSDIKSKFNVVSKFKKVM